MATIKIRISPDGSESKITVEGVPGTECERITKDLEEAVFAAGAKKEYTPEYYMEDQNVLQGRI